MQFLRLILPFSVSILNGPKHIPENGIWDTTHFLVYRWNIFTYLLDLCWPIDTREQSSSGDNQNAGMKELSWIVVMDSGDNQKS